MTFLMFLQQLANWFPSVKMRTSLGNSSAYPNLYSTFSTELAGPQSAQCPGWLPVTAAVRGRPGEAWRVAAAAMAQYDKKIYMQLKLMPTASTGP